MIEELDLFFLCRQTFITEPDRSGKIIKLFKLYPGKKRKDIEDRKRGYAKEIYFDSKNINKILDEILYSLDKKYLIYFLYKFSSLFGQNDFSKAYLKEEEINSLAVLGLYFTLEAKRKNNFEIVDVIKHIKIRENKKFVEKNIQTLYFS